MGERSVVLGSSCNRLRLFRRPGRSPRAHPDTAVTAHGRTERPTPDRAHCWPKRAPLPDQESGAPVAVSGSARSPRNSCNSFAILAALLSVTLVSGCAGPRTKSYSVLRDNGPSPASVERARKAVANLYPPRYRATQRAIITVGRKQFVCDGVLTVSPEQGAHLAVISTLGLVAEVRVTTNGAVEVLKVTPLFREAWSRDYVARDLLRLFVPGGDLEPAGRLPDGRLVLETRPTTNSVVTRYIFTPSGDRLQELEVSRQERRLYRASVRRYQKFAGYPFEIPSEFEVVTPNYRLELRTAELVVSSQRPRRGPGGSS
jgi:hypothetical protein